MSGFPSETGSDRLAELRDRSALARLRGTLMCLPPEEVLALVEIARGLERIEKTCDVVVQRIAEVGEPPAALSGTQIDAERMRDFARAALARLDRPSGSDGGGVCDKCGHAAHKPGDCPANVGTGYFGPVLCRCGVEGGGGA